MNLWNRTSNGRIRIVLPVNEGLHYEDDFDPVNEFFSAEQLGRGDRVGLVNHLSIAENVRICTMLWYNYLEPDHTE